MSVIRFVDSVFLERHLTQQSSVPEHGLTELTGVDPAVGTMDALKPSAKGLNALLIQHPAATFLMEAEGADMAPWGVQHGDVLIVDRAVKPTSGRLVVAPAWGELRVAWLHVEQGRWVLTCGPKDVLKEDELSVWGVITTVIRRV